MSWFWAIYGQSQKRPFWNIFVIIEWSRVDNRNPAPLFFKLHKYLTWFKISDQSFDGKYDISVLLTEKGTDGRFLAALLQLRGRADTMWTTLHCIALYHSALYCIVLYRNCIVFYCLTYIIALYRLGLYRLALYRIYIILNGFFNNSGINWTSSNELHEQSECNSFDRVQFSPMYVYN